MRVDFMVSHCWGLWRQSCALCFFTSRAALRRPRRRPSARLPDKPPHVGYRVRFGSILLKNSKMELKQKFATDPSRPVFGNRMPCSRATKRVGRKSAGTCGPSHNFSVNGPEPLKKLHSSRERTFSTEWPKRTLTTIVEFVCIAEQSLQSHPVCDGCEAIE